jgi:hypothetical protein
MGRGGGIMMPPRGPYGKMFGGQGHTWTGGAAGNTLRWSNAVLAMPLFGSLRWYKVGHPCLGALMMMPPRGPPGQMFGGPRPYMDRCGCWLCSWLVCSLCCFCCVACVVSVLLSYWRPHGWWLGAWMWRDDASQGPSWADVWRAKAIHGQVGVLAVQLACFVSVLLSYGWLITRCVLCFPHLPRAQTWRDDVTHRS